MKWESSDAFLYCCSPEGDGGTMLGKFAHALDSKGRLTLPARYRPFLAGGLVLTKGADRCLFIFPQAEWEKIKAKLDSLPVLSSEQARSARRALFGNAVSQTLDSHSRITLPTELRTYAHIEKDVIGLGLSTYIELWAPAELRKAEGTEDDELPAPDWSSLGI